MIDKYILKHSHKVSENDFYRAYKIFFNTLASEQRLRILNLLREKVMNASEIQKRTKLEQTAVSHNLRKLREHGFVFQEKKWKYRYYTLNTKTIKPLLYLIDEHMKDYCLKIIQNLKGGKNEK